MPYMNYFLRVTGLFLFLAATTVFAEISAEKIRSFPQQEEKQLIYANAFEDPALPGMELRKGFKLAPNEGNNGNCGLRVDRLMPLKYAQWAVFSLPKGKFKAGTKYTVSFYVRAKDFKTEMKKIHPHWRYISVSFTNIKTGKRLPWTSTVRFTTPPPTNTEYKKFSFSFFGIKDAQPKITLKYWENFTGTLWFDDLCIYSAGFDNTALLVWPRQNTFRENDGKFKLHYDSPFKSGNIVAAISLEKNKKIIKEIVTPLTNSSFVGSLGTGLPTGCFELKIYVADTAKKKLLKKQSFSVNVSHIAKAPQGAAMLDEHDRLRIDDKTTFPIGIFYAGIAKNPQSGKFEEHDRSRDYKRIAGAGIDFIMDYASIELGGYAAKNKLKAARIEMDNIKKHNLKLLFCGYSFYGKKLTKKYDGLKGSRAITTRIVDGLKNHPALLGWYINDELPENEIQDAIACRSLINKLDPWHPTLALSNLASVLPRYALSGDIYSPDVYPLKLKSNGDSIKAISKLMEAANRAGVPVWGTMQTFSWGALKAKNKAEYDKYINPSEEDMRSMAYYFVIYGVKGLMFYTYFSEFHKERLTLCGDPGYYDDMLLKIKRLVSSIRFIEPFVLSLEKPPTFTIKSTGKVVVEARAFKANNGKICLIIVGPGGGKAEAVITVPEIDDLKSKYGHTVNLGGGKYKFTSAKLGSDVLSN